MTASDPVREHYAYLMAFARGESNDDALACMLATRHAGGGALPERLGLTPGEYRGMLAYHFPGALLSRLETQGGLAAARADEAQDLRQLLLGARAGQSPSEAWVAEILVAGCMGSDHLWQDLGLWARKDLSALMQRNFPALAARNDRDMKWKKFLYKQLCETEGIYTCRAPSCEVCVDFHVCFGPED